MPPVRRKARALRGTLDPELLGALELGPGPRARAADPLIRETLREAYAEHHEVVDETDAIARVPGLRSWAFWEFSPAVPPELREGSQLEYHERKLARAGWLAATGRLARWELARARRLAADGEAESWHPWRDMVDAMTAHPAPPKAPPMSRRSTPKAPAEGATTPEGDEP
jgi:hypothetical protein